MDKETKNLLIVGGLVVAVVVIASGYMVKDSKDEETSNASGCGCGKWMESKRK